MARGRFFEEDWSGATTPVMVVGAPAVAAAGGRFPPGGGPGDNIHFANPPGSGLPTASGVKPAPSPSEVLRASIPHCDLLEWSLLDYLRKVLTQASTSL